MRQVVSFSGGRDSTAMLLMMIERGEHIDDILYFDWGLEFPQVYAHIDQVESHIGRGITRLYPPNPFDFYLTDWIITRGPNKGRAGCGWPFGRVKWCTRIKVDAIRKAAGDSIDCIGYAYHERFSRARYRDGQRYPLLEWGVTSQEGLLYCESRGFTWGGLYKSFNRLSCWCCPLQPRSELLALKRLFPDLWTRLLEMEKASPWPWPNHFPPSTL